MLIACVLENGKDHGCTREDQEKDCSQQRQASEWGFAMPHAKDGAVLPEHPVPPVSVHVLEHPRVAVLRHVHQDAPAEIVEEGCHLFLVRQHVVKDALLLQNDDVVSAVYKRVHEHHVTGHDTNIIIVSALLAIVAW